LNRKATEGLVYKKRVDFFFGRSPGILAVMKHTLYAHCVAYLDARVLGLRQAIENAQQSANAETKSSVGDKYETSRAMAQLEIEKYREQLADIGQQASALRRLDPEMASATVQPGSVVMTNRGNFFIAIAAGKLSVDGLEFFLVSAASPIAKALTGKKTGDELLFQENRLTIARVE
jgi:transcription elongation GreA/GreB family factor